MNDHEIHEHHEHAAQHHEHAAKHLAEPPNITKPAIMKRLRITPRSRMAIMCTPSSTTSTPPRSTPKSTTKPSSV
jgi:hypothetical protein